MVGNGETNIFLVHDLLRDKQEMLGPAQGFCVDGSPPLHLQIEIHNCSIGKRVG
jgi:hypothetical protein